MSDPVAYNEVTKINPPLASALYQYVALFSSCITIENAINNAKPANETDVCHFENDWIIGNVITAECISRAN